MGKTALDLTPEERRTYHPAEAIERHKQENQSLAAARREMAWKVARQAAEILKNEFHASRVVVFGSLADEEWFTPWSDIDLAAWGIAPSNYFSAVAAVTGISTEINVDLIDPEDCSPSLLKAIKNVGIDL